MELPAISLREQQVIGYPQPSPGGRGENRYPSTTFECIPDYIHWNPVRHGLVKCAADWPYSTFLRFVAAGMYPENWGIAEGASGDEKLGEQGGFCPPFFKKHVGQGSNTNKI